MTQRITRLGFSRDCFAKQFIILEKELCDYSDICEFQKLNFLSVFLKQNKKKVAEIKAELSNFYSQHLSYVISVNKQNLKKLKNWRKQQKKQLKSGL